MLLGGRYRLLSAPLSTGSFGSVFVADDERMPRRVAVKILHPQHAENPTVRARFRRELEAACRVSHENVVSVFDIGEDPNLGLYYVMELVKGTPLKDYLNGQPLPWAFVFRVATQLARALHAIHAAGIVHRDLKPQNIMLVERSSLDELVKVLDFGIASLKTPEEERRDVELTGARMVLGTPPYMSPEQTYMRSDRERLGLDVDARSDVYSMGVILYELAAGRRPFSGDAHDIVVAHRLTKPMPLDRMVGVAVPREFADLVMRCLSKDPKERPQSSKEFLSAVKECELKPVRRWDEVQEQPKADPHDMPTMGEEVALPIDALPVDTRPRLEITPPARPRSLWAPLVALGVGAVAALIAFLVTQPEVRGDALEGASEARPGEAATIGAGEGAPQGAGTSARTTQAEGAASDVDVTAAGRVGTAVRPSADAAEVAAKAEADAAALAKADAVAVAKADAAAVEAQHRRAAVMVTTQPPGAVVLVDGKVEGESPLNLSFDTALTRKVEIVLRKDKYEDFPVAISVGPELSGKVVVVNQALKKKGVVGPSVDKDPFKDL